MTPDEIPVQVTFDALGPSALGEFWAVALNYRTDDPPAGFESWEEALRASDLPEERWDDAYAIVPRHGAGPRVFFQKVPEGKSGKNRVHLDVSVGRGVDDPIRRWDLVQAHVARLVGIGATVVAERRSEWGDRWMVLQDPEGNEFCVQ